MVFVVEFSFPSTFASVDHQIVIILERRTRIHVVNMQCSYTHDPEERVRRRGEQTSCQGTVVAFEITHITLEENLLIVDNGEERNVFSFRNLDCHSAADATFVGCIPAEV